MDATTFLFPNPTILLPGRPIRAHPSTSFSRHPYPASHSSSSRIRGGYIKWSAISCGMVKEINESQFREQVVLGGGLVLVEFVANWCGPCRLISPAIDWAAQEYKEKLTIVKIDHDLNPRLIEEYKVYGLPTLILFKNGEEVPESRREGAITKVKLKAYIDALLDSVSVS